MIAFGLFRTGLGFGNSLGLIRTLLLGAGIMLPLGCLLLCTRRGDALLMIRGCGRALLGVSFFRLRLAPSISLFLGILGSFFLSVFPLTIFICSLFRCCCFFCIRSSFCILGGFFLGVFPFTLGICFLLCCCCSFCVGGTLCVRLLFFLECLLVLLQCLPKLGLILA